MCMSEIFKSCKSSREMTHLEGADKMGSQWQSHSRPERLRSFRSATKKLKNIAGGIVAFGTRWWVYTNYKDDGNKNVCKESLMSRTLALHMHSKFCKSWVFWRTWTITANYRYFFLKLDSLFKNWVEDTCSSNTGRHTEYRDVDLEIPEIFK